MPRSVAGLPSLKRTWTFAWLISCPRSCRLTSIGKQVFDRAVEMDAGAQGIARMARAAHAPLVGRVILSAPPVLVTHLLAERLPDFRAEYPDIRLSLSAQGQRVSLSRREADVAVRFARSEEAGSVMRKLGTMAFGLYAHRSYPQRAPGSVRTDPFQRTPCRGPSEGGSRGLALPSGRQGSRPRADSRERAVLRPRRLARGSSRFAQEPSNPRRNGFRFSGYRGGATAAN